MICVHKRELSNRDLAEPKREDNLPDVVFDDCFKQILESFSEFKVTIA